MEKLNYPPYEFRFKNRENKNYIFDMIRKKFVLLTPEEWVRQNTIHFLVYTKGFPKEHLNIEKLIKTPILSKRYDIVIYKKDGSVSLLVECKAPSIKVSQAVFDQIAQYNRYLNAQHLMLTNGINHFFFKMDYEKEKYVFLSDIPAYKDYF